MAHIGIDARLTGYRMGGISSYTLALLQALAEIPTYHKFSALVSRKLPPKQTLKLPTYTTWTPPHHRLERWALSLELLPHRLDIFHATDFIPPQFGAKHFVATIHDLTFLHFPEHKDRTSQQYYIDQIDYAVKHACHLFAVSEATKNDMIRMLNVPEEKITIQPHGVDSRFQPVSAEVVSNQRIKLNLPEHYILFVGTLEPRKNIPCLLNAYLQLPKNIKDNFALLLVGQTGWLFDDTLNRIHNLQAQGENIQIRHDIDNQTLPTVYALAHVFVMPSFYEGFGMPILEAQACGTPVIASDNSSLPQVVGDAGLLFATDSATDLAKKLEFALTNVEWRASATRSGIVHASAFTWQKSAEIALSVYTAVSE